MPGNGLDQIGEPLSSLDDLDCSDISDNAIVVVREEVLSVEDNVLDVSIRVFPNPTSDVLNISSRGMSNSFTVNVYSITGQIVNRVDFANDNNTLDVTNLSDGVYLLEFIDATNGATAVKRFIKN